MLNNPFLLALLLCGLVASFIQGVNGVNYTWYVSSGAAGGNNGTSSSSPFTLSEVVNATVAVGSSGGGDVTWIVLDDFNLYNLTGFNIPGPLISNLTVQSSENSPVTFACTAPPTDFLFTFSAMVSLTLQDITIFGCGGSVRVLDVATTRFTRMVISNSTTQPTTVLGNSTDLFITNCTWVGNKNPFARHGGALLATVRSTEIAGTVFVANTLSIGRGTGAFLLASSSATRFVLRDTRFDSNVRTGTNGGAGLKIDSTVYSSPSSFSVLLDRMIFVGNAGNDIGGLELALGDLQNVTITRSLFQDQISRGVGGLSAILQPSTTISISQTAFIRNRGRDTGGTTINGGIVHMTECLFDQNGCTNGVSALQLYQPSFGSFVRSTSIKRHTRRQQGIPAFFIFQGWCSIESSDISFNQGTGLLVQTSTVDISFTTIWANSEGGITCDGSSINASLAVSVHSNNPGGYFGPTNTFLGIPIENTCSSCAQFTLPRIADACAPSCNSTLDVCSQCNGTESRLQNCLFPPDLTRKSTFILPTSQAKVAFTRPPLGETASTLSALQSGVPSNETALALQPVALREHFLVNGSVNFYDLTNGRPAQGVPVVTPVEDQSPSLDFDYRTVLPNGASMLLRQNLLATLRLESSPGIPSFFVDSNKLKLSWELTNWPLPANGPIELEVQLILKADVTAIRNNIAGDPNANNSRIYSFTLSTATATYTVSLANFYSVPIQFDVVSNVPILFESYPIQIVTNFTVGSKVQSLLFRLPNITSSWVLYDPDFGVILPDASNADDSSGGPELLYLLLLVLVLVPIAILVVALVAGGYAFYNWYQLRGIRPMEGSVSL